MLRIALSGLLVAWLVSLVRFARAMREPAAVPVRSPSRRRFAA